MRVASTLSCLSIVLVLAACNRGDPAPDGVVADDVPPGIPQSEYEPATDPGATASAVLAATEGNAVDGALRFEALDGGVRATGQVSGLEPGEHGFHLHETGDCSAADGSSAGGHFNPGAQDHGRLGAAAHHGGDTDNLVADAQGVARVDTRFDGVTLGDGAATDIVGRAVIVHADPDDYRSQPSGNAGARLACAVIEAVP